VLLDWITARVPMGLLTPEAREKATQLGDRLCCYCPKTGDVRYESAKWDSVRSDSHQVVAKAGGDLWIQGAPGRVCGDGDSVFGCGAPAALDLVGSLQRMVDFLAGHLGESLPPAHLWIVSRVDVTGNFLLGSLGEVQQALSILRGVSGGRYRISSQAGDTCYWSEKSKLRKGKAYAKGPHLRHLMKQRSYSGRRYSETEIEYANKILRLELTLGREWFARNPWKEVTAEQLSTEWENYFFRMIGGAEVNADCDVRERIFAAAAAIEISVDRKTGEVRCGSQGMAAAAHGCWVMIQSQGWERAREMYSKATWYRHMKFLHAAGLADADISAGRVVQLRRRIIEAQQVHAWPLAA
jgi:II/X family phage/plasmid replication protein